MVRTYQTTDAATPRLDRVPGVAQVGAAPAQSAGAVYYGHEACQTTKTGRSLRQPDGAGRPCART